VSLNRNDGFVLKSWTGNCAYFDANGNYLGMLPESLPDDPDDWVTGDTIYVKCLKAQPTQMASAMTDMAVLAGASAQGAIPDTAFAVVSAQVQAQVEFAPTPHVERENGELEYLSEDDPLLALAGFVPDVDELFRWRKTIAYPGEIFKLIITHPPRDRTLEYGIVWDWTFDRGQAHIKDIEEFDLTHSLGLGPAIYNVCYVEADNKYVTDPKPIGVIKISAAGSARALKTIIVEYGEVKEYTLNVIKHELLAKSRNDVEDWFKRATEEVFLWDSYPQDNQGNCKSIRERFVDEEDVNCPIALVLGRFEEFEDKRVKAFNPPEVDKYLNIDNSTEYGHIRGAWEDPAWDGIDVRKMDIILVESIYNAAGRSAQPGYGEDGLHIFVGTSHATVAETIAHEFGHYAGNLDDTYICSHCGQIWRNCTCTCGNCGLVRRFCGCDLAQAVLPQLVEGPQCPNNFMGMGADNSAVLPVQRDKLK